MSRAMGLDIGTKTIGISLSDPTYLIAQAHGTILRSGEKEDLIALDKIIKEFDIEEIVVGLPLNMNHSHGPSADRSKQFAKKIEKTLNKKVFLQDERLSTVSANRVLMEGKVRREKRKQHIDSIAATFILQTWLDSRR